MTLRRSSMWLAAALALGVGVALALHTACRHAAPPAPPLEAMALADISKTPAPSAARVPTVLLQDITVSAGIRFRHVNGAAGEKLVPETMGGGVAFFDYDNDGDPDLLFVNSEPWPWQRADGQSRPTSALYRNDGDCRFTDVTNPAGLDVSLYGMGVAVGDFDADGWSDVFISALGPDKLLRNEQGRFVDVTAGSNVAGAEDAWGTSCCWFDYNRDGRLDLFVCNYLQWSREIDLAQPYWVDKTHRAYIPPRCLNGAHCSLYRNDGGARFTDVSAVAGIHVVQDERSGQPGSDVPVGKALGVVPLDLDGDAWQDLVVANDGVRNFLFHNRRDGTFEEVAHQAGIAFDYSGSVNAGMGIDIAPWDGAKALAVAIGTFSGEMTTFHVAEGGELLFRDQSAGRGLASQTLRDLQFAMLFLDYDLDGRMDLLAANGHIETDIERVSDVQTYAQHPALFWNAGADYRPELLRVPVGKIGESFAAPLVGRGAAYADIDGDGDLDLVITQVGGPPRLFRNDQDLGHHWLRVKVLGCGHDREALGAVVRLRAGSTVQVRHVGATHGYLSQSELPVTFGLGSRDVVDSIEVLWPGGQTAVLCNPEIDRLHVVSPPPCAVGHPPCGP